MPTRWHSLDVLQKHFARKRRAIHILQVIKAHWLRSIARLWPDHPRRPPAARRDTRGATLHATHERAAQAAPVTQREDAVTARARLQAATLAAHLDTCARTDDFLRGDAGDDTANRAAAAPIPR